MEWTSSGIAFFSLYFVALVKEHDTLKELVARAARDIRDTSSELDLVH